MKRLPLSLVLSFLVLGSVAACGDDDPADPAASSGDLTVEAEFDEAVHTGQNTLVVTVSDAAGDPVVDATVTVDPRMPMMDHGSTEDAVVTNNGDGTYTAFPVTFQMSGAWVVTVDAESGDSSGTLALPVDVP